MLGVFAAWVSQRFGNSWRNYRWLCAIIGLALLIAMYATLWTFSGSATKMERRDVFARTFRFSLVSLGFALLLPIASLWKVAKRNSLYYRCPPNCSFWFTPLYLVRLPLLQLFGRYIPLEWKMSLSSAVLILKLQVGAFFLVSASLYRFYESRCTHLREKVAPLVADLGKRARRTNSGYSRDSADGFRVPRGTGLQLNAVQQSSLNKKYDNSCWMKLRRSPFHAGLERSTSTKNVHEKQKTLRVVGIRSARSCVAMPSAAPCHW